MDAAIYPLGNEMKILLLHVFIWPFWCDTSLWDSKANSWFDQNYTNRNRDDIHTERFECELLHTVGTWNVKNEKTPKIHQIPQIREKSVDKKNQ